jgi:hypothetical protein
MAEARFGSAVMTSTDKESDVTPRDHTRRRKALRCGPQCVADRPKCLLSPSHGTINNVPTMLNRFGIHSVDFLLSR